MDIPKHQNKVALTIAGSDSGGGAGIQADLKTFEAHGVFGLSVITALTAQNSTGVEGIFGIPPHFVALQLDALMADFPIAAAKTGMLYDGEIIEVLLGRLKANPFPLVVDTVMVATSGHSLIDHASAISMMPKLLAHAAVITPNIPEAHELCGVEVHDKESMLRAAKELSKRFPQAWILVKGGHWAGATATDLLYNAENTIWLELPRIDTQDTHGTGCTLSAAITANIALGLEVPDAVRKAKSFLQGALQQAWSGLGKGHGSPRHNYTRQ
jgi:hydroxymethylpyrimidine kinase/phosphomethylpyrimidine kinase